MKYNKQQIMTSAWKMYRKSSEFTGNKLDPIYTFSHCLKTAWSTYKSCEIMKMRISGQIGKRTFIGEYLVNNTLKTA